MDETNPAALAAHTMAICLPVGENYPNRQAAVSALELAVAKASGHAIRCDSSISGGKRAVYRCSSTLTTGSGANMKRGVTTWTGASLSDFQEPEKEADESKGAYKKRVRRAREKFAIGKMCNFKAVMTKKNGLWSFTIDPRSKINYHPHSSECTTMAKLTGASLRAAMKPLISADTSMKGKVVANALTSSSTSFTVVNLPSTSSMSRAQKNIKQESDAWYNEDFARLEKYLKDFKEKNPECHVVLEKDKDNRFERCFIGFGPSLRLLARAGLDMQAVDACDTRHHIFNGARIHIVMGRSGMNTTVPMGLSISMTETNVSYRFLAKCMKEVSQSTFSLFYILYCCTFICT